MVAGLPVVANSPDSAAIPTVQRSPTATPKPKSPTFPPPPSHYPSSGDPPDCARERLKWRILNSVPQPDSVEIDSTWIINVQPDWVYGLVMQFFAPNDQGVRTEYEAVGVIDTADCGVSLRSITDLDAHASQMIATIEAGLPPSRAYCNAVRKAMDKWSDVAAKSSFHAGVVSIDPSLRDDPDFMAEVAKVEQSMREAVEDLREIKPPSGAIDIHAVILKVADALEQSANLYLLGVEQASSSMFDQAADELSTAEQLLTVTLPALQDYCGDN